MNTGDLLTEIRAAFPLVAMPAQRDLRFHSDGCVQCRYLSEYLDERRGHIVDGPVIRYMHQEMSCLSAKGWAWALPHYLPFCLTPEAEYNKMETEFLVYNLGPDKKFQNDRQRQLALLSSAQLRCLVHFLEWLQTHPQWSEYFPSDIRKAIEFLHAIGG